MTSSVRSEPFRKYVCRESIVLPRDLGTSVPPEGPFTPTAGLPWLLDQALSGDSESAADLRSSSLASTPGRGLQDH